MYKFQIERKDKNMSGIDVQRLSATYATKVAAEQALNRGDISNEEYNALIQFKNENPDGKFYVQGAEVEQKQPQAGDAEKAKASAAANQQAVAEMQQTKAEAAKFNAQDQRVVDELDKKDEARFAKNTGVLKEGLAKIDTKEKAMAAGFTEKTSKHVAKAAKKNEGSMEKHNAVEKIFTDKAEYNKAVKEAKANGTWNNKLPKYTLLEGKQLEAAHKLQEKAQNQVLAAQATFAKYRALTEQYDKTDLSKLSPKEQAEVVADRIKANNIMKGAALVLAKNYNASQMFDKDGNLNTKAFKDTMLEYAGSDFRGNLDERKVLQKSLSYPLFSSFSGACNRIRNRFPV